MKQTGPDLVVEPAELAKSAKVQDQASGEIVDAKVDIKGLVGGLTKDHGLICTSLVNAMKAMEKVRNEAADNLAEVSTLLAENLNAAAARYTGADEHTGRNINDQVRT